MSDSQSLLATQDPMEQLNLYSDSLNLKLIKVVEIFAEMVRSLGYQVEAVSAGALKQLPLVSREHKSTMCAYYEQQIEWIKELRSVPRMSEIEENDEADEVVSEKALLKKAIDHYGFLVGDDFWKTFEKDLIIEIYGENMIQLYRSLSFYELTGYSVLDLSVFEWYVLWERPRRIMDMMAEKSAQILEASSGLATFEIPRHVNREIMNTGYTEPFIPRAFLIEFKHITSLKTHYLGKAEGILCTCRGEIIAEGEEAASIQFI